MNAPAPQELEAARLLLARLGVDPTDLITTEPAPDTKENQRPIPTISEWIPVVASLVSPSTAASYGSYWNKAEAQWGDRRMDTITATEIKALSETVRRTALVRRNPAVDATPPRTSSPPCTASTSTSKTTAASSNTTTPPDASPNRATTPPRAAPSPTASLPSSTRS